MRILTLDIETMPTETGLARLLAREGAEVQAPVNYKDPAKIAAYVAEKRAALQTRCEKEAGLSPLFGQVVSVALWDGRDGGAVTLHDVGSEAELLRQVATAIVDADLIVTFNGRDFDVPFLNMRMLVNEVTPTVHLQDGCGRNPYQPHCDLRKFVIRGNEYAKGTLADVCAAFGVPCPGKDLGITGADVARLARTGQWDLISDYNMGDSLAIWGVLQKVWPSLCHYLRIDTGIAQAENLEVA